LSFRLDADSVANHEGERKVKTVGEEEVGEEEEEEEEDMGIEDEEEEDNR
jgi:hypothetical protein